ncbi:MAG: TolC family protein [Vicinamibacterales bacterium]
MTNPATSSSLGQFGRGLLALTLVGITLLESSPARAQTAEPPAQLPDLHHIEANPTGPPVVLADLVAEALARNPELAALRRQADVVRQRPAQARALDAPMAEAQIWQWPINSINPADTTMYMFMVTQTLPGRGKRQLRAAVADQDVALADSDIVVRAREIVDATKQAYAALFIARKAIQLHLDSIGLLRQIADVAQVKYATGRISQQDVLKPVVELSRHHADVITFDEQARLASARLNVLLNRPPDAPIGPLVDPPLGPALPATADLQRMALDRHPELLRARTGVARAEAALAVARSDEKPDFLVQGGYMLAPRMTDGWSARVGITWPKAPWSRGRIDARVAEETNAVQTARARAETLENAIRLGVQEAYVRARSAQDRAALLRTSIVPQSQQTLDVSRVAYQADRVDFQTLIDNERVVLAVNLDYVRALSDLAQALADLERAVGADLPAAAAAIAPVTEGQ